MNYYLTTSQKGRWAQLFWVLFISLISCFELSAETTGPAHFSGELKKWHKVTLTFNGPQTNEGATPNPFTDYRLNVVFKNGNKTLTVPGYYAADGNASESGASAGNKWKVHLAPELTGRWTYTVSFRKGTNVAMSSGVNAGNSGGFMDGSTGYFDVIASDKTGRDNRAQGRLQYVNGHYLQYAESKKYFLKQGADAPENLLAYQDFDGNFKNDGIKDNLIKTWSAHVSDWQNGNPTWKNGKGKGIIGAINYLASEEMNVFSFLTMNIQGDDRNVFPYTNYNERYRMDCSKLDQWEIVLNHGDKLGMYLHFKTQETENDQLLDGGNLGNQRKLYYRELIARFSHHLALNWNLGEENTNTAAQAISFADYFHANDPYQHNIVIHTYPGQKDKIHTPLLGNKSKLTGLSLQTNNANFLNVFKDVKTWVDKSAATGRPWVVACDEPGDATHALVPDSDDPSHNMARKNALWATYLAGGVGNEWYFGYKHAHSDLTCQDFRSRDLWWDQCRHSLRFFYDNDVPFWEMKNDNSISSNNDDYVFYKNGEAYVVYLKNGGTTSLNLQGLSGSFKVKWYNPRTGGALQDGSVKKVNAGTSTNPSLGTAPSETSQDWVILITKNDGVIVETEGYVVLEVENSEMAKNWIDYNAPHSDYLNGYTGNGYIRYTGNSEVSGPANDVLTYQIKINNPGSYKFLMRALEAPIETNEGDKANDCYVRMVGQAGHFGQFKKHVLLGASYQWSWNIQAEFSHHSFSTPVYQLSEGLHTFQIAGRSKNFHIDRVVLYKDLSNAEAKKLNLENPESEVVTNEAPTINAGSDVEILLPVNSTTLNATVSDDGLPENSSLSVTWSKVSGPGDVTFSSKTSKNPTIELGTIGDYVLECRVTDGQLSSSDRVKVSLINPDSISTKGAVIADAYLQGSKAYNSSMLRVEANNRTAYLQFSIPSITGVITSAKLVLTEGGDVGNGTIQVYSAAHSNWEETNLSTTSAPEAIQVISSYTGVINSKQVLEFDVTSHVQQTGFYAFILKMPTGNDVAFSSKEGNNPPQLIVESELPINQEPVVSAGPNRTIKLPTQEISLNGSSSDDGLPFGSLLKTWKMESGPSSVDFSNITSNNTKVLFHQAGTYILSFTANDGELEAKDQIQVIVNPEDISVTKLVLVDSDKNVDLKIIHDGDTINTAIFGSNLNIRAEVLGPVSSVQFQINGSNKVENVAPYALAGDTNGDYKVWANSFGEHAINVTPYYGAKATGGAGISKSVQIGVMNAGINYNSITQYILVNSETNEEIRPLFDGSTINLTKDGVALNILAKTSTEVESVRFDLNEKVNFQTENVAPFALAGDTNGDFKNWTPSLGENTLYATPFTQDKAKGIAGETIEIKFNVISE